MTDWRYQFSTDKDREAETRKLHQWRAQGAKLKTPKRSRWSIAGEILFFAVAVAALTRWLLQAIL